MVRRKNREAKPSKTLTDFTVTFEPIFLPEEEDNERIKRLAKQILECIERAKRERGKIKDGIKDFADKIFGPDYDEVFGLT